MKAYNLQTALQYPEQTTALYMHNRNLEEIPEAVFTLKNLKVLGLGNNRMRDLPLRLKELRALEEIDLTANKLDHFPAILPELKNLKVLNLSNNRLTKLPETITNLERIEVFNASHNSLESIPKALFFPTLKSLDLSANHITKWPLGIKRSQRLEGLFLQKNKIKKLPDDLSQCKSLRTLNLNENRIKVLPQDFGVLNSLEKFTISNNKLDSIPESIAKCTWLRELDFGQNKIQKIPASLGKLNWLFRLNLQKNQLENLPESLGDLSKLRTLNLEYNKLKALPASLQSLVTLQFLMLKGNAVATSKEELIKLGKLEKISGFNAVFTSSERRQFLSFLKYSRKLALTNDERIDFFKLISTDQKCTKAVLINALNFPMKAVREKALNQFFKYYNEAKPLRKDSVITITGKSNLNKKKISEQVQSLGLKYQTQLNNKLTHIVLGHYPNQAGLLKLGAVSFLREQELQSYISAHSETSTLAFTSKAIENLRQLLESRQEESIQLAIRILQNALVPKELITDLFIAYKLSHSRNSKKSLSALLKLNASEELQQKLSLRLSLNNDLPRERLLRNINRYAEGTELEAEKIFQQLKET